MPKILHPLNHSLLAITHEFLRWLFFTISAFTDIFQNNFLLQNCPWCSLHVSRCLIYKVHRCRFPCFPYFLRQLAYNTTPPPSLSSCFFSFFQVFFAKKTGSKMWRFFPGINHKIWASRFCSLSFFQSSVTITAEISDSRECNDRTDTIQAHRVADVSCRDRRAITTYKGDCRRTTRQSLLLLPAARLRAGGRGCGRCKGRPAPEFPLRTRFLPRADSGSPIRSARLRRSRSKSMRR